MSEDTGNGNVTNHRLKEVEKRINELTQEMKGMREDLHAIYPRLSVLEWKSGMWGAIAGAVMVLGAILMQSL